MAGAILTREGPRGHLRVILLACGASMSVGVASCWAQGPWGETDLPFCPIYPPGHAPAIGPSNCVPIPETLWGPKTPVADLVTQGAPIVAPAASPTPPAANNAHLLQPIAAPVPAPVAKPLAPPAPQAAVVLRTPGAITLDQIAAMLGPVSKRSVNFSLSATDDYKKTDLTHRVTLTWSGPLQALVDQLGAIYGLDVAIDDTAIRFSSRQGDRAGSSPTTRTP